MWCVGGWGWGALSVSVIADKAELGLPGQKMNTWHRFEQGRWRARLRDEEKSLQRSCLLG